MTPEIDPKSFGTFEKEAPDVRCMLSVESFSAGQLGLGDTRLSSAIGWDINKNIGNSKLRRAVPLPVGSSLLSSLKVFQRQKGNSFVNHQSLYNSEITSLFFHFFFPSLANKEPASRDSI